MLGASSGVMDSKLDKQTFTSEFKSHWVPPLYDLVPHLRKKLSKLLLKNSFLKIKYWLGLMAYKPFEGYYMLNSVYI